MEIHDDFLKGAAALFVKGQPTEEQVAAALQTQYRIGYAHGQRRGYEMADRREDEWRKGVPGHPDNDMGM